MNIEIPKAATRVISGAMRELAATIQCNDGIANMACAEAAERLDEQQETIDRLREVLKRRTSYNEAKEQCGELDEMKNE